MITVHGGGEISIAEGSPQDVLGIQELGPDGFCSHLVGKRPDPCPWDEPCKSSLYLLRDDQGIVFWVESQSSHGTEGRLEVATRRVFFGDKLQHLLGMSRLCLGASMLGPLAHELNNVVQGLSSAEYLIRDNIECGEPVAIEDVDQLAGAVKSLKHAAAEIQNFSRSSPNDLESLDIKQIINRSLRLLHSVGKTKSIELATTFAEHVPMLHWRRSELEFIVLALLSNAAESAQGSQSIPRVALAVEVDEHYLELCISDSGTGFDLSVGQKPFVSGKPGYRHAGLGLSAVSVLIASRGGSLHQDVVSEGSMLRLRVPVESS